MHVALQNRCAKHGGHRDNEGICKEIERGGSVSSNTMS
eukprot:CAMPEP_0115843400 /NCGR_PEP_ID=MMETSP0287-20121206/8293_1 /TAXON_ID=412157 /ORGANISM="Chrysochromulina rotalis, Strain UIO044" /LENGTH=37 /DNA_ID= /DNA_START= /DNA_END= /DNA_ORIENTATION=